MSRAIRIDSYGGVEQLQTVIVEVGDPGPGEVRLRQHAIGLNYIDIYQRTGLYKLPALPAVLGLEGAGVIEAVGPGVDDLQPGDRVAYASCLGAYADVRLAPADKLVRLPDAVSFETAAAMMLQGMTVRYLLTETFRVGPETTLLFHAAAGGVGLIASQWAAHLGATMIGTASTDEKAQLAKSLGCKHVINSKREDIVARVAEITDGRGCDVVYDSIGKDTVDISLACLKPKGLWVSFGNASGPVPPFDLTALRGSLFVTRPSLFAYTATRAALIANANDLFQMVATGALSIPISARFALEEAASAHAALESRQSTGSIILVP